MSYSYSMKIKSSLGNEVEDRTGVHQGKLTTDNFDFRRISIKIKNSKSKLLITCETLIYKFKLRIVDFK